MTTPNQNNAVGRTVGPRRRSQVPSGPTRPARVPAPQQVTAPHPVFPPTPQPPVAVPGAQAVVAQPAEKSRTTALLFVIFLGPFGAHNFYLGYRTRAWWQLGLMVFGLVTSLFLIGFLVTIPVGIWAFVDFIRIVTRSGDYSHDADGRPLC